MKWMNSVNWFNSNNWDMKSTGTGKTPHGKCSWKHFAFSSAILETKCMFLFRLQEGETVLISAARDGHLEVVRTLLSKYADVEAADSVSSVNWNILTSSYPNNYCRFLLQILRCNGVASSLAVYADFVPCNCALEQTRRNRKRRLCAKTL